MRAHSVNESVNSQAVMTAGQGVRGFTLLELLVAITVTGLLSAAIVMGWRVALSAWGKAEQVVERDSRVVAVHELIEKQIAAMAPVRPWLSQGRPIVFFQGEHDRARFVSRYSLDDRARAGLVLVDYLVAEGFGGKKLLLTEIAVRSMEDLTGLENISQLNTPGGPPIFRAMEETRQTRVLLESLAECRFEYLIPANGSTPSEWQESWGRTGDSLPRGMALRLASDGSPPGLAPVSVVAMIQNYQRPQPTFSLFRF